MAVEMPHQANVGKIHKAASIHKISHISQCYLYKMHVIILCCGGQGHSQRGTWVCVPPIIVGTSKLFPLS